jgi:FkbH-like protein
MTMHIASRPADLEVGTPELSGPQDWLRIARMRFGDGDVTGALDAVVRVADGSGPFPVWAAAAGALAKFTAQQAPVARRTAKVAIAGTYTTSQLGPLLRLAALRRGLHLEIHETGFGLGTQEILDPTSALHAFAPDYVVIAPHEGAIAFPPLTVDADVEAVLAAEVRRWQSLWDAVRRQSSARIVQHNLVIRPETTWGHVSVRTPGARESMLDALNRRLAAAAGDDVLIVDVDRVASAVGKNRWFDDRYWHLAKQAVSLEALPELARHTAAVLAAAEGLTTKCIALDLDNTLWGGVVGEAGLPGLQLGGTPQGEAFLAFQEHLLALRGRGILLAVVSKNNDADAREVFERHPDMRMKLSDFAAFRASWDDKPSSLRAIAAELGIGLDAIAFVDDNPVEREIVRALLPEVEVVALPGDPSGFVRALSDSLLFETASLTGDDLARAGQYRARADAAVLAQQASSLQEFYAGLGMQAWTAPFDEQNLPRIAQLVGKTNQFNLTGRRHGLGDLRAFAQDPSCITMYLRLRDQFGDHGLVAALIARVDGDVADIDTWLMSCRVVGRTVENEMLARLCRILAARGIRRMRGTFVPSEKNQLVEDVYGRLGFTVTTGEAGTTTWDYDIAAEGVVPSDFIGAWNDADGDA